MNRFCTNCGAKITDENQNFCNECGSKLNKKETNDKDEVKTIKNISPTNDAKTPKKFKTIKKIFLGLLILLVAFISFIFLTPSDEKKVANDKIDQQENTVDSNTNNIEGEKNSSDQKNPIDNSENQDVNTTNTKTDNNEYKETFYSVDLTCTNYKFENEQIDSFLNKTSTDILFLEKDMYQNTMLNFSSPTFNQRMYLKTYNKDIINAEYISENVESFFKGQVVNEGNIFAKGKVKYKDYVNSLEVSYDVIIYKSKDLSLNNLNGDYEFNQRNVWLKKAPLDDKKMDFLINKQKDYLKYPFELKLENNSKLTITPKDGKNYGSEYIIDLKKQSGYLKVASNPLWVGENIEITPVYHPQKTIFYFLLNHKSENNGIISQSLEGYISSSLKTDTNNSNNI